ncbi:MULTISPECIES: THUMP domain-containing class I SAM-dependent RNA methyltransferase [Prochlorococcus]|uniref:THUMP domain-containing class I SAM-dependent RNA methyltransferase n=1 Tax=Prochlorococcus TaxID=1218 RepID=UPI000533B6B2|nr:MULTISPECIES: THUMP domain-containing protein [Prochlorococcus]KGG13333.1 23S rRNA (guanine-N-2-) -methyltransferase rlmL [Prochlorococcus sp. MIT 0601]
MKVLAVLPPGLETEGANELQALGALDVKPFKGSVFFQADLSCLYRVNLLARLPFRFLREIARFSCRSPKELYWNIQNAFNWNIWLHPSKTFRVDVSGISDLLPHTHFTALQVKNALVDFQRNNWGHRSDIDTEEPDICFHLHLNGHEAVLSLDTAAFSLHRRGYRPAMGLAPLKENLAAGLIRLTGWDFSTPLVDPLCGSGILLIEAVSMAIGIAPGLNRSYLFENWPDFDSDLWDSQKDFAQGKALSRPKISKIIGCEKDFNVANQAKDNIKEAGLEQFIEIHNSDFGDLELPNQKGFLVCNPPYGKRSGSEEDLPSLYQKLGSFCKQNASGWQLWLLSGNPNLSRYLYLKANKRVPISNGGIDCRWLHYSIK